MARTIQITCVNNYNRQDACIPQTAKHRLAAVLLTVSTADVTNVADEPTLRVVTC